MAARSEVSVQPDGVMQDMLKWEPPLLLPGRHLPNAVVAAALAGSNLKAVPRRRRMRG